MIGANLYVTRLGGSSEGGPSAAVAFHDNTQKLSIADVEGAHPCEGSPVAARQTTVEGGMAAETSDQGMTRYLPAGAAPEAAALAQGRRIPAVLPLRIVYALGRHQTRILDGL